MKEHISWSGLGECQGSWRRASRLAQFSLSIFWEDGYCRMACRGSRPYGRAQCLGAFLGSAHGMRTWGRGGSGIRQREKLDYSVVLVET